MPMIPVLTGLSLMLLGLPALFQAVWAWRFARLLGRWAAAPDREGHLPRTAVILSLRGADPSLADCLEGLLRQNYPCYDVWVVVDNRADPAWTVVQQVAAAGHPADLRVCLLEVPRQTCSLKLSAILQVIGELDDSYPVVALIDADVIPHRDWLRDLAGPLADPAVGATTGIRWFTPWEPGWGTAVRYLWGAAAATQMYAFHIPWGGSLAFRVDLLRDHGLLGQWERSLWEDTIIFRPLRDAGLELRFVPAATMITRESTDLGSCFRFIRRQLLNVRLYHPGWPAILAHGIASALGLASAVGMCAACLAAGRWEMAAWTGGAVTAYVFGLGIALALLERRIHRLVERRGQTTVFLPVKVWPAIPVTQVFYLACLASAALMRRVVWRGITYEVRGPCDVRMVAYHPYEAPDQSPGRTASLV
jgi:Glycosyltransferase like family 2